MLVVDVRIQQGGWGNEEIGFSIGVFGGFVCARA